MTRTRKPLVFDQPSSTDVHVDAPLINKKVKKSLTSQFLSKLYDELKSSGELTQENFQNAVKKSRSHAGGKMKAANRAMQAGEMSLGQRMEMINAELREEFQDPFQNNGCRFWYAQEIYDDRVIVRDSDEGTFYQIAYTVTDDGECEFGEPEEVEQVYTPKAAGENNILDIAAKTHGFRFFNEVTAFAEPPDRIPLMPKPSTHKHAAYGEIVITKARNKRFAKNINDHVYQEKIPIDLEHQLKLSGAAGYITSAEVNSDGSVDGIVEWTDLGKEAIENDRYAYVSPEWYDSWTHPMSEETFADVVIGAALTTRPFFKEESLRPLIASESGLQLGDVPIVNQKEIILHFTALAPITEGESMTEEEKAKKAAEDAAKKAKESGVDPEPSKEFSERLATAEAEAKSFKERADKAEGEVKKMSERVEGLEKTNRTQRFNELAKDWIGEKATHLTMLEHLATSCGEDSELFKAHVVKENATATQFKSAGLFTEIGSAGATESTGVMAEIEAEAVKMASESNGRLTKEQAFTELWEKKPNSFREQYRIEQRSVN